MPLHAEQLAAGLADATFDYQGESCTITYRTKALTKEFKAQALRLTRESARIQARSEQLMAQVMAVGATEGTPEAEAEQAAADEAIRRLLADDEQTKRALDAMVAALVDRWDVIQDNGAMLPITLDSLFPLPADFETLIIQAVSQQGNLGEASAGSSLKISPLRSKPGELPATSPLSPNSTPISTPANGALQ